MRTISLRIRYRPIRFGWCVRDRNLEDVRRALRLTHTLWGGRYNPIIPVGNGKLAGHLVELFRVDALYGLPDDPQVQQFIQQYPYLAWPGLHKEFFIDGTRGKMCAFLDIYHPVRRIFEEFVRGKDQPKISPTIYGWEPTDPLADVWLAYFGAYPTMEEIGKDYGDFVERNLRGNRITIGPTETLPPVLYKSLTPGAISSYHLQWERAPTWENPGLYVGSASDFEDLVNFWNLRASDIDLVFYDPQQRERLRQFVEHHLEILRGRPSDPMEWGDRIAIWSKDRAASDVEDFGPKTIRCTADDDVWNGFNVKPPLMYISEEPALASVTDDASVPSLAFQLAKKPFYDDPELHTHHLIASLRLIGDIGHDAQATFKYPYIPELNKYYAREVGASLRGVRSELDGIGVVICATTDHVWLRAVVKGQLVCRIFETFGMSCEPSPAGRVATRLIHQMDGIQGCRVFKIAGVRKLIEAYGPLQTFTRSEAIRVIGQNDPLTGRPNFEAYEDLYIEPRERGKLKPEDAFIYLLKRGVFRVGLILLCPNCELNFWLRLDDLRTEAECEYCGKRFNVTPQLRDRDWAYRRSGLFGREDHQQGSIPVALTLQQLETVLNWDSFFATAMNVSSDTGAVGPCETDFVVLSQKGYDERVQLAVGECKAGDEISSQDVSNLARVADAFPSARFKTFIIFSKTGSFAADEIERCRSGQAPHRWRVILLSGRELEPYFVYERTQKEFDIRPTAISLDDLARATQDIYFEPKPKKTKS